MQDQCVRGAVRLPSGFAGDVDIPVVRSAIAAETQDRERAFWFPVLGRADPNRCPEVPHSEGKTQECHRHPCGNEDTRTTWQKFHQFKPSGNPVMAVFS